MRVLLIRAFVEESHPTDTTIPHEIAYTIAMLEKHHTVKFIDEKIGKISNSKYKETLNEYKPDIVGINFFTPYYNNAINLSHLFKEHGIPTFAFGQHATTFPDSAIQHFDYCVLGEPEITISELINNLSKKNSTKNIDGIAYFDTGLKQTKPRALIQNLDSLPFPNIKHFPREKYSKFYITKFNKKMKWGFIQSSRGCKYKCIFCSPTLRTSYGHNMRFRSAKNIISEIRHLKQKRINIINFVDDDFLSDKNNVLQICNELIKSKLKIPYVIQSRVDKVDEEVVKFLKNSGCQTICLGVESGSQKILNILNKQTNIEQIKNAFKLAHKYNLETVAYIMIGNPTETSEDVNKTRKLIKELEPTMLQASFFTPYPGSSFYPKSKKTDFSNYSHYNKMNINYSSLKNIKKLQQQIYRQFYFSPKYLYKNSYKVIKLLMYNNGFSLVKKGLNHIFRNK